MRAMRPVALRPSHGLVREILVHVVAMRGLGVLLAVMRAIEIASGYALCVLLHDIYFNC